MKPRITRLPIGTDQPNEVADTRRVFPARSVAPTPFARSYVGEVRPCARPVEPPCGVAPAAAADELRRLPRCRLKSRLVDHIVARGRAAELRQSLLDRGRILDLVEHTDRRLARAEVG